MATGILNPLQASKYLLQGSEPPEPTLPILKQMIQENQRLSTQEQPDDLGALEKYYNEVTKPRLAAQPAPSAPPIPPKLLGAPFEGASSAARTVLGAGEAGLGLATSVGGFVGATAQVVSKILNDAVASVAQRGPITAQKPGDLIRAIDKPNFYTNLGKEFTSTIEKYGYQPRTEIGQNILGAVGLIPHVIKSVSDYGKKQLVNLGMRPDDAEAVGLGLELLGFIGLDKVVRSATGGLRSTIAKFKSRVIDAVDSTDPVRGLLPEKAESLVQSANDLTTKAEAIPEVSTALQNMRARLAATLRQAAEQQPELPFEQPELLGLRRPPIRPEVPEALQPVGVGEQLQLPLTRPGQQELFEQMPAPPIALGETVTQALKSATTHTRAGQEFVTWPNPAFNVANSVNGPTAAAFVESLATAPVKFINSGQTSAVLDIGGNRVARMGIGDYKPIPNVSGMLQPISQHQFGEVRVEIFPKVEIRKHAGVPGMDALRDKLMEQGQLFHDYSSDNVGFLPNGEMVVIDPGAIMPNTTPSIAKPKRAPRRKKITEAGQDVPTEPTTPPVEERPWISYGKAGYAYREMGLGKFEIRGPDGNVLEDIHPSSETGAKGRITRLGAAKPKAEVSPPPVEEPVVGSATEPLGTAGGGEPKAPRYFTPGSLSDLDRQLQNDLPVGLENTPKRAVVQLRYENYMVGSAGVPDVSVGKPTAMLIDTSGLNTTTSLANITRDVSRGRLSRATADAMIANLRRQADAFGVAIEDAHNFTGETLKQRLMTIADTQGIELYQARRTPQGVEYEQVPLDTVRDLRIFQQGDLTTPKEVSAAQAGRIVEERTKPVGPATMNEIRQAIESGDSSIIERVPEDIRSHVKAIFDTWEQGIGASEARRFVDILKDLSELITPSDRPPIPPGGGLGGERGSLSRYGLTANQRAAARRLQADALRKKIELAQVFEDAGLNDVEKTLFTRYLATVNRPLPPAPVDPYDVALDARAVGQGDFILHQRERNGVKYAPKYWSEVEAIWNSKPITITSGPGFDLSTYKLRQGGVMDPIGYAAREAFRARDVELAEFQRDLKALGKDLNIPSRERVGAYAIQQQPRGELMLKDTKYEQPITLTPPERTFYNAIRELFNSTLDRINDVREAIGQEIIDSISDYFPFMRMFTVRDKLGLGTNLLFDDKATIMNHYSELTRTPFVHEIKRKGALYTATLDAFDVTQTYMQRALEQINIAPFSAKLRELIEYDLPNPVDGKINWSMREHNPTLQDYLHNLNQFLITGSNFHFLDNTTAPNRMWNRRIEGTMQALMRNQTYAVLSGYLRSGIAQFSSTVQTGHALGWPRTLDGLWLMMKDVFQGGKLRKEMLENSAVIDTRQMERAFNEVSNAVVGGNAADFLRLLRRGEIGKLQTAIAEPGLSFMNLTDHFAAEHAWVSGYEVAKRKLGYEGRDAYRFADDIVVMTQGGSMPVDLAEVQRSTAGKFVTQFQRFVIAEWNYLLNEVFGERYLDILLKEQGKEPSKWVNSHIGNVARFLIAVEGYNALMNAVGIPSPRVSPILEPAKAIYNSQGEPMKQRLLSAAGKLAGEVVGTLPVAAPTRYGRGLLGPVVETALEAIQEARGAPLSYRAFKPRDPAVETLGKLFGSPAARLIGLPYSGTIGKYLQSRERGESVYKSLTTYYTEKKKGGGGELPSLGKRGGEGLMHLR